MYATSAFFFFSEAIKNKRNIPPNPQISPLRPAKYLCESFLKMSITSIYLKFFHLNIEDIV